MTALLADDQQIFRCISRKTVENHRATILSKTGVQGKVGLTTYAARIGLIGPDLWE